MRKMLFIMAVAVISGACGSSPDPDPNEQPTTTTTQAVVTTQTSPE